MKRAIILASISVLCLLQIGWSQVPQTMSYQGVLKDDSGNPVDGPVNLAFSLYSDATGGIELWGPESYYSFEVTGGIFQVILGSSVPLDLAFDTQYWLQITVNGGPLSPRTKLTAVPYSLASQSVAGGTNIFPATGNVGIGTTSPDWKLVVQDNVDGYARSAFQNVNTGANRRQDIMISTGGSEGIYLGVDQGGALEPGINAYLDNRSGGNFGFFYGGGSPDLVLDINGNVGIGTTSPATALHVIGTVTATTFSGSGSAALDFHVNNVRALRLEPNTESPNIIGGYSGNFVNTGVVGGTIGGGGNIDAINSVMADYATVNGGRKNTASGIYATVGGGYVNTTSAIASAATVGGGWANDASNTYATVGGGWANTASGSKATVGGGQQNIASNTYATVGGGTSNAASGENATVGGGKYNRARGLYSVVSGGGGPTYADSNAALGTYSTVAGGRDNTASSESATVSGGGHNTASNAGATVGGGWINTTSGSNATIGGGVSNVASGTESTIGGGYQNIASGLAATVPGGPGNVAAGNYSFAAGRRAKANNHGTFVWADSTNADFASTAANQFLIRASGGVGIGTASPSRILEIHSADNPVIHVYNTNAAATENAVALVHHLKTSTSDRNALNIQSSFSNITDGSRTSLVEFMTADNGTFGTNMVISGGNVGIGMNSPGYPLEMGSGAHVTTGGAWTDASSREYKEDIATLGLEEAVQALRSLEPVKFKYKHTRDERHVGFIAEDVPELVATRDRKGLSPMDIAAVLTRVVKDQQREIEALQAAVADLQTQVKLAARE